MQDNHDRYIILLAVIPLILFVGLYMTWQSAGQPPIAGPDFPMPSIPLPSVPDLQAYLPPWLVSGWHVFLARGGVVVPAVGLGVFIGLVGFGTLIDLAKSVWSRVSSRMKAAPAPTADEIADADLA